MCTRILVHISRHLGKTSNNINKRCQLCIRCMLCQVCFHQVLHQIFGLWSLLYYSCLHPALPLMFYSTSLLLLSYYTCVFPAWYHLLYIYMLPYACAHDSIFNACLWFRFIDTRVLSMHAIGICITTRWGVLTPLDPHVQFSEFGACGFSLDLPCCWLEMRRWSTDHQQTIWSPILLGPLRVSRVFPL